MTFSSYFALGFWSFGQCINPSLTTEIMSYKKEHPHWVAPSDFDIPAIEKLGFEDMSWHNDAFPFWGHYKDGYTLGVDYEKEKSEFPNWEHRYHLYKRELAEGETEHECLHDESEHIFSTNSFSDLLDMLKGESE